MCVHIVRKMTITTHFFPCSRSSVDSPGGGSQEITAFRAGPSSLVSDIPAASSPAGAPTGSHHHHHQTYVAVDDDSDFQTEPDAKDWREKMTKEQLDKLGKKEKQRQDVINGESDPPRREREGEKAGIHRLTVSRSVKY